MRVGRVLLAAAITAGLCAAVLATAPRLAAQGDVADTPGESVVAALSQNQVAITATFVGSEILIFGAVKRDAPAPDGPLEVVIAVQGPSTRLEVRRKERVWGIWINTEAVEIDLAPSFYAVATTGPFARAMSNTEDLRYKVSIPQAIRSVGAPDTVADAQVFSAALMDLREASGAYQMLEGTVALDEDTLFRTRISLPANLTEGTYTTRIFLTRGGMVVDQQSIAIDVRKEGLERLLFALSVEQPVIYGILSLSIAILAGWAPSALFRYFRS